MKTLFDDEYTQKKDAFNRICFSDDSAEWYTPQEVIKSVHEVLGSIDLDPASCLAANQVVQAKMIYTKDDDGLSQAWHGRIFTNPPYGRVGTDRQKGQTELWIQKLIDEYELLGNVQQAILLVNAYLYKQWFAPLWAYPICFPTGRFSFWNADGKSGRSPHSSALVYFGHNVQKFVDVFSDLGPVAKAMQPNKKPKQPTLWD
jgi:ParB family chromosome partitioning protein